MSCVEGKSRNHALVARRKLTRVSIFVILGKTGKEFRRRKKIMKRITIVSLALCLSFVIAGCATNQQQPSSESKDDVTVTTETKTSEEATGEGTKASHQVTVETVTLLSISDGFSELTSVVPKLIVDGKEATEINASLSDYLHKTYPMEKNGDYLAKSTLSRVFAEGSEEQSFRYEETIRPIANALLDIENIEDTDDMDIQAMKSLLKYKIRVIEDLEKRISELESALDKEKIKSHEKIEQERERFNRSIDFLKEQINYKDQRMDLLLSSVQDKDKLHKEMLEKLLTCSKCEKYEG